MSDNYCHVPYLGILLVNVPHLGNFWCEMMYKAPAHSLDSPSPGIFPSIFLYLIISIGYLCQENVGG